MTINGRRGLETDDFFLHRFWFTVRCSTSHAKQNKPISFMCINACLNTSMWIEINLWYRSVTVVDKIDVRQELLIFTGDWPPGYDLDDIRFRLYWETSYKCAINFFVQCWSVTTVNSPALIYVDVTNNSQNHQQMQHRFFAHCYRNKYFNAIQAISSLSRSFS